MPKAPFLEQEWFTLPLHILARPSVMIGEGGSGKTESSLKAAHLGSTAYDMDIIYIPRDTQRDSSKQTENKSTSAQPIVRKKERGTNKGKEQRIIDRE